MTSAKAVPPKEVKRESKAEVPVRKTETVVKEKAAVETQRKATAEPTVETKIVGAQKVISAAKSEPKIVAAEPKMEVVEARGKLKAVKKAVKEVSRGPLQQLQDVNDLNEKCEEANVGKCSPVLGLSALLNCSYFDKQLLMHCYTVTYMNVKAYRFTTVCRMTN